jgi:hypothetical protein
MAFKVNIDLIVNGEVVDSSIINRPLQQLNDNDNYLKSITDSLVTAQGVTNTVVTKTSNYTAANESVILVNATTGTVTISLPAAALKPNWPYVVKKIDSSVNTVVVDPNGAETIDGAATKTLTTQYQSVRFISNGTAWSII